MISHWRASLVGLLLLLGCWQGLGLAQQRMGGTDDNGLTQPLEVDSSGNLRITLGTALASGTDSVKSVMEQSSTQTESQVSCTNSSATLKAANTNRVEIEIRNIAATTVYICRGTATCTTSVGNRYQENDWRVDDHYTGIYTCITSAGTATVYVSEVTR